MNPMTTSAKEYRVRVLSEESCTHIATRVSAMRHLAQVGSDGFFYTLGNALYQNKDPHAYFQKAARFNALLFEEFGFFYEDVLRRIASFLGCETGFLAGFSFPGFHLFEIGRAGSYDGGGAHFDLSYQKIFPGYIPALPHYSFTVAVRLPAAASGLDIWDLHYKEMQQMPAGFDPIRESGNTERRFVGYQVGEMVIFDGHYLHRIAATHPVQPEDQRITLQGHCLFINGYWAIYF